MELTKDNIIVIQCKQCGANFAGCVVGYIDEEYSDTIRTAFRDGDKVIVTDSCTMSECTCSK